MLQALRQKLDVGVVPPAALVDKLEACLDIVIEMQDYTKGRFASMQDHTAQLERDKIASSALEQELRQQITQYETRTTATEKRHAQEMAARVPQDLYLQVDYRMAP